MSIYGKVLISVIFSFIFFKASSKTSAVNFPFRIQKTNLTNIQPKKIVYPSLTPNNLYIEMKIGTNPQIIPLKIEFSSYLFYISGENTKSTIKFDETNSSTFKKVGEKKIYNNKNLQEGYIATDYTIINDNKINTTFILGTNVENDVSGVIGLNIEDSTDENLNPYNYISELKKNNVINGYYFTIKYNDNESGNLIIGELSEIYDSNYKNAHFIDTYTELTKKDYTWKLRLDYIFISDNLDEKKRKIVGENTFGYFYVERKVIGGTEIYRQEILNYFFSENINNRICFEENTSMYFTYYCKKNVDFTKFKNLYFYNKNLDYNFKFTYKDLFFYNELDENYYFLIIFNNEPEEDGEFSNLWIFGEPIFKKYQLIFNKDTKKIGLYTDISNNINKNVSWFSEKKWYLLFTLLLIILLIGLGVTIILYIKKGPKKKSKANELEDDFEYSTSNDKDQKLFSS